MVYQASEHLTQLVSLVSAYSLDECWREFFDSGLIGVALTAISGRYIATNSTFRDLLGYRESEIQKMFLPDFTDGNDPAGNGRLFATLIARGQGHFAIEKHHRRGDGSLIWLTLKAFLPSAQTVDKFLIALVEDISEAKRAEFQAVDGERRRLAQGLHDTTAQNVIAMIMDLDLINLRPEGLSSQARTKLTECIALAQQSLLEIRTLSYLLHPPMLDKLGFVPAIRMFARNFAERSGMQVEVDIADSLAKLPSDLEVTLYRVAQEGVTNAHRHADSSNAIISLMVDGETIRFCVKNEGTPRSTLADGSLGVEGVGIASMRERVRYFGGDLLFHSGQNRTVLEAIIPTANIPQMAANVENVPAHPHSPKRTAKEEFHNTDESHRRPEFTEIIGDSQGLKLVFKQIEIVAPTDSSVLILGETGTGKERIARAIHKLSPRRDNALVTSNCASIPAGLLESELFGHEKGAFTGAATQEIGRFERANKGTIFLDEIGDIPLELQSKLLRVLQEREINRIGSTRAIHVNFRLVAATNRDLVLLVEEGKFRSDLYYRLNVFPITLPPLRERPEDIPLLAWHFAQVYGRQMNKRIDSIRPEDMEALVSCDWPGNVRELQNVIERAVVMSRDAVLHCPLKEPSAAQAKRADGTGPLEARTLAEAERRHVLQALQATGWVIGGPNGAAARLSVKRTTLLYKMRRLGISRAAAG